MHTVTKSLLACAAAAWPAVAAAQDAASTEPTDRAAQPWSLTLETTPSFTFRADLDDDAGSVSVLRTDFAADFSGPIGDRLRLTIGLFGGVANYDFNDFRFNNTDLDDGPLEDTYEAGLSLLAIYAFDEQWYALARGSVVAGWADDADIGDAIFGTAAAGLGYRFSDNFSLALGGGFITRLEDNVGFLPLVVIDWQISETLSLKTTGVGLTLASKLSEQWSVFLRGGGDFHQYRLDDSDNNLPESLRGGAVNDTRVPVGIGLEWNPAAGLTLSLEGGVVVWQQFELRNDDEELDEIETDPAAYIAGRLSYRF